jgi:hypothetical protein
MTEESMREIRGRTLRMTERGGKTTGRHGLGVVDTDWAVARQVRLGP